MSTPKLVTDAEAAKPEAAKPEAAKPEATKPEPAKPVAAKPAPAQPETKAANVPKSAVELRAARRRILQRRYGIWVGIPTLLAIVYYLFVATPQYDARVVLAIESGEGRLHGDPGGKSANAGNQRDVNLLRESLRGDQSLAALDRGDAFRSHYRNHGDWLSRLSADAGPDATLAYFRDKITINHDTSSNVLAIRVRAFSGEAAHDFAAKLVEHARGWIDQQNKTASSARLGLAKAEVTRERAKLATAAEALAKADQPKPTDPVAIDHQVAVKRLEVALGGVQDAMNESARAQRYLIVLDGPSRPDTAAVPRRAWGILTVCLGALVLVSVLSLLGASVREHAKF